MKRIGSGLVLVALASAAVAATPASAHSRPVDSYCSPTGDYCVGVFRSHGRIAFSVRTFSFRGEYELCIRPPGEAFECSGYRLVRVPHGIFASRIDFGRNFAHDRPGRYAVEWKYEGFRLGSVLHFHHG
ncbi:MAG: hypothetical protein ACOYD4_06210 [Solirubrobacterales bacterium]